MTLCKTPNFFDYVNSFAEIATKLFEAENKNLTFAEKFAAALKNNIPEIDEGDRMNINEPKWLIDKRGYRTPVLDLQLLDKLAPGYYNMQWSSGNAFFEPFDLPSDEIFDLPDSPTNYVMKQIEKFWQGRSLYQKFNFLQKRGILFYGPPGCGKSSILNIITQGHIKSGGVVIKSAGNDPSNFAPCLKLFRLVEPTRPVIILLEDFETMIESSNGSNVAYEEQKLLALLDGNDQINNVLVLATTNKPDVIADRFIKRPGRFDLVIGLNEPTALDRKTYIHKIVNGNLPEDQLNELVKKTEGFSLAHLREIVSCYLVLGVPIEESATRLKINKQTDFRSKSSNKSYVVGF